jgi:hypothetical protein
MIRRFIMALLLFAGLSAVPAQAAGLSLNSRAGRALIPAVAAHPATASQGAVRAGDLNLLINGAWLYLQTLPVGPRKAGGRAILGVQWSF